MIDERVCIACFLVGFIVSSVMRLVMPWTYSDVAFEFIGVLAVVLFAIAALVIIDHKRTRRREWAEEETRRLQQQHLLH